MKNFKMTSIVILAVMTSATAWASTDNCIDGLKISSISADGTEVKLDNDTVFKVDPTGATQVQYWGQGQQVRICDNKLSNISFRSIPTVNAPVEVEAEPETPKVIDTPAQIVAETPEVEKVVTQ